MIKRYGLGANPEGLTLGSMRPSLVQIVEREDGGYVRYEDYAAAMESIGAGGVSGRIIKKTLEQHRAEFETAYAKLHQPDEPVYLSRSPDIHSQAGLGHLYNNDFTQHAWTIWALARGIATFE